MLGRLATAGWNIIQDPSRAHTIIVNTCSFIESAIEESIDTILDFAAYKQNGPCRRLIVTGCLPERFREKNFFSVAKGSIQFLFLTNIRDFINIEIFSRVGLAIVGG